MSAVYITITGMDHYYSKKPFEIGGTIELFKEPDNEYDSDAIYAALPLIGKIGYVANSPNTVVKGTLSAGRIYDKIGSRATAKVMFVTHSSVIAEIMPFCITEQFILSDNREQSIINNEFDLPAGKLGL